MLPDDVRAIALLLPEVVEGAHMGHPDFRVGGKIFATLWVDEDRVVVKLTPEVQAVLTEAEPRVFEAISGSWGRRELVAKLSLCGCSGLVIAWIADRVLNPKIIYLPTDSILIKFSALMTINRPVY